MPRGCASAAAMPLADKPDRANPSRPFFHSPSHYATIEFKHGFVNGKAQGGEQEQGSDGVMECWSVDDDGGPVFSRL